MHKISTYQVPGAEPPLKLTTNTKFRLPGELSQLQQQYSELLHEFDGTTAFPSKNLSQANDPSLTSNFAQASTAPLANARAPKSVRFRDDPSANSIEDANRAGLFPYHDDPSDAEPPDHGHLDNQQIHQYHNQVLQDQDQQLDRLGRSIGRQRELSIAIGDELDGQAQLLDDVDDGVTRHQSQIDRARKRLGKIARKAKDNATVAIILSLIIILILLIVITK